MPWIIAYLDCRSTGRQSGLTCVLLQFGQKYKCFHPYACTLSGSMDPTAAEPGSHGPPDLSFIVNVTHRIRFRETLQSSDLDVSELDDTRPVLERDGAPCEFTVFHINGPYAVQRHNES